MNCYEILGLSTDASSDEIIQAHRNLAKKFHPDKHRDSPPAVAQRAEEMFKQVQEAYETLTKRRAEYDKQIRAEAASVSQGRAAATQAGADAVYPSASYPPPAPRSPARRGNSVWQSWSRYRLSTGAMLVLAYGALYAGRAYIFRDAPAYLQWSTFARMPITVGPFRAERFEGNIHNPSTNSSASVKIAMIESGGRLSGCMAVDPPLSGSGPVSGHYSRNDFNLSVSSAAGQITLKGERRDEDLWGTYTLDPRHKSTETGTFTLWRIEPMDDDEDLSFMNCPTDEDLNQK